MQANTIRRISDNNDLSDVRKNVCTICYGHSPKTLEARCCPYPNDPQSIADPTCRCIHDQFSHYYVISSVQELQEAHRQGCRFCSWILRALIQSQRLASYDPYEAIHIRLRRSAPVQVDSIYGLITLVAVDPETAPWVSLPVIQHFATHSDSKACIDFGERCIEQCARNHGDRRCGDNKIKPLPTRVLDVGSETTPPRLVVGDGAQAQYIALSHCWGLAQRYITIRQTLKDHKKACLLEDMPKTFQDAVKVARDYGIRYLWIDSLCILQDDQEDWEREASSMGDVYSNAYFVLCASCAASDDEGFLRSFKSRHPPQLLESIEGSGVLDTIIQMTTEGSGALTEDLPIESRAWCLQELLLARRVLSYASHQVKYLCTASVECDQSVGLPAEQQGSVPSNFWRPLEDWFFTLDLNGTHAAESTRTVDPEHELLTMTDWWLELLRNYTDRQLTRYSDQLPALSGIAAHLNAKVKDTYLAGLWSKSIIRGLHWTPTDSSTVKLSQPSPSFSWCSIIGSVRWNLAPETVSRTTLIEAHCQPSGLDAFGQVSWGYLRLRGRVIHGELVREPVAKPQDYRPDTQLGWRLQLTKGQDFPGLTISFLPDSNIALTDIKDNNGRRVSTLRRSDSSLASLHDDPTTQPRAPCLLLELSLETIEPSHPALKARLDQHDSVCWCLVMARVEAPKGCCLTEQLYTRLGMATLGKPLIDQEIGRSQEGQVVTRIEQKLRAVEQDVIVV